MDIHQDSKFYVDSAIHRQVICLFLLTKKEMDL